MSLVNITIYNNADGSRCGCGRLIKPEKKLGLKFGPVSPKEKVIIMDTAVITTEQKLLVSLDPETAAKKPAQVEAGKTTWTKLSPADPDGCTIVPSADGLSAEVTAGDNIGDSVFQVDADADLTAETDTISVQFTVTVVSPKAASLGLSFGTPEAK